MSSKSNQGVVSNVGMARDKSPMNRTSISQKQKTYGVKHNNYLAKI